MSIGAWGSLLDRVTSWLPIQTKKERLRNAIDKLEKRQEHIKKTFSNDKSREFERNRLTLRRLYNKLKNTD